MARIELERLLGGYATGTLTERERNALFEAALEDQRLFDSLADEEALKELLDDPVSRARLLETLEARSQRTRWPRKPAVWFRRPSRLTLAGGLATAAIGVWIVVSIQREQPPQTGKELIVEPPPPASSPARQEAFSRQKETGSAIAPIPPPQVAFRVAPLAEPGAARGLFFGETSGISVNEKILRDQSRGRTALEEEKSPAESSRRSQHDNAMPSGLGQENPLGQGAATPLGLRYGVLIHAPAGEFVETHPDRPFSGKDRLKLTFEPNQDGYLYVLENDGTNWSVLFPEEPRAQQESDVRASVTRGSRYTVPSAGYLTLAASPAGSRIVVLFSRRSMFDLGGSGSGILEGGERDMLENELIRWRAERASAPLLVEKVDSKSHREDALYFVNQNLSPESVLLAELVLTPAVR